LSEKAAGQYEKSFISHGKRGTIYDTKYREMAVSIDAASIAAYPHYINNSQATAKPLAKALKINISAVKRKLSSKKSFVWIKRQITPREKKAVEDLNLNGIGFIPVGREFDAEKKAVPVYNGKNLILTIDRTIQYITEKALEEAVNDFSAKSGIAIVIDPNTGAVLSLAHFPFFNPNSFQDFNREKWRNRAITDPFEPGSTMKIFTAAAALEYGNCTPNTIFFGENGAYRIGENIIHDTKPHGWMSLQQIVKYSSNIGAVKVGEKIGKKALYQTLRDFGFGKRTGIDCPGETTGSMINGQK
jgi:cell division protein FtsI (penicillin-binding protein 3)